MKKNIKIIHASIVPLMFASTFTLATPSPPTFNPNTYNTSNQTEPRIILARNKGGSGRIGRSGGRIGRSGGNISRGRISSGVRFRGGSSYIGGRSYGRGSGRSYRRGGGRYYGGYGGRFYGLGYFNGGFGGYGGGYGYSRYNYGAYYPPAVVIPSTPPVYVEKEPEQTVQSIQASRENSNYWHYCRKPEGYYPYVRKCEGGWLKVAPHPAQ